jgi:hypothetical protein
MIASDSEYYFEEIYKLNIQARRIFEIFLQTWLKAIMGTNLKKFTIEHTRKNNKFENIVFHSYVKINILEKCGNV